MAKIVIHKAVRMNQHDPSNIVQMDYEGGSSLIGDQSRRVETSNKISLHPNIVEASLIAKRISTQITWIILCVMFLMALGCKREHTPVIAMIPRTTGIALWEPVRDGAIASSGSNAKIYWNAPTREDNVEGQITLLDREIDRADMQGIILAADHSLALVTPIRRGLAKGIPIVVIRSPLSIPAGGKLTFILNDE